jgi:NAD dependent epimerase/dehydratase family enzyme
VTASRAVVAGASGFLGTRLVRDLRAEGTHVATIGRAGADALWGDTAAITRLLDGADLLVNLAGRSVNCRYGYANRAEILRSRTETTGELARAAAAAATPPTTWMNSSTATIYRHADDRPMTEAGGELGEGFSVGIAKAWEEAFFAPALPGVRRIALRTAIVLGPGSVMVPLTRLARFGLGGAQLDGRWPATRARLAAGTYHRYRPTSSRGRQRFSWIHLDDVVGAVRFLRDRQDLDGVVNLAAPEPSDSRTLMRQLRGVLGVPVGLPAPRAVLEVGSWAIRTETELVLKSRWVVPQRLLEAGFTFRHPDLEGALRGILRR